MLPNSYWDTEEIAGESKMPRGNENWNMTYQNLWDAAKVVLRGKLVAIQAYLRKQEKSNKLSLHLKELERKEVKPKSSRRKEIIEWK